MTVPRLARRAGRAGLAAALAGCGAGATTPAGHTGPRGSTFSPQPSPTVPTNGGGISYSAAPSPTASQAPGTLILQGSGKSGTPYGQSLSSPFFYVAGTTVTVTYEYDCVLLGDAGYFTAELHARSGDYARAVVDVTLVSDHSQRSADEPVPGPGYYYLTVRTDCPWKVSVTTAG